MQFNEFLEFKGTWRNYQKRVLDHADAYLKDGKIHIVAAPGSGKTTLGIELIKRVSKNALVLAPSITIREQWVERIKTGFLKQGKDPEEYLSQDIRQPKAITVITYQALHSAMKRYQGTIREDGEEEDEENTHAEVVDYSGFDLLETIHTAKIEVICLDECHHLRSEWWKAIEEFRKKSGEKIILSLTATPPYDSTPAAWERYISLCGPIDEEITVPELVKEGSLCPHQDYVYFNYPTREEKEAVDVFKEHAQNELKALMEDEVFAKSIESHTGLMDMEAAGERFLDDPGYLAAILIFFEQKGITYNEYLKKLLGVKKLPVMNTKWMEKLLQGFLYDDRESYYVDSSYIEELEMRLKHAGLITKRKVSFEANEKVEKLLISSKGKIESIKQIVKTEYESMGKSLRMLILTDYIRKEYMSGIGNEKKDTYALGVIPFFELLRRTRIKGLKLGVLCGSVVIIPSDAKDALNQVIRNGSVTYKELLPDEEEGYVLVTAAGNFLTAAVTRIFQEGHFHVLIGTKSLLGEGWDAPCINSLILASFVGSYMLSNQMRGRAIRTMEGNPEKTSNIWHLVCVEERKGGMQKDTEENQSEDYRQLKRRMENFMGLHYEQDRIENGMDRLSIIVEPFSEHSIQKINKEMCERATERQSLKARWHRALAVQKQMEVVKEVELNQSDSDLGVGLVNVLALSILSFVATMLVLSLEITMVTKGGVRGNGSTFLILFLIMAASLYGTFRYGAKALSLSSPLRRLQGVGKGILDAMRKKEQITSKGAYVNVRQENDLFYFISLKGGTSREKELFADCVSEFYNPIENERYLLVNQKKRKSKGGYYVIPDAFARKKEDAEVFALCLQKYIGKYEAVYTRTPEGRKVLLEARTYAFANRQERCMTKKKVKSALE